MKIFQAQNHPLSNTTQERNLITVRQSNSPLVSDGFIDDDNWEHYSDNESNDEEKPEKVVKSVDHARQGGYKKNFQPGDGYKKPYNSTYNK
jgi:hypothetical protein